MPTSRKYPPNTLDQIVLGEAASEGPEGLMAVLDTMVNRARRQGKSLEEVATAPYQFSAAARKDLPQFYERQPPMLRNLVRELIAERRQASFQPSHPYEHYVTDQFWGNRLELPETHWVRKMRPAKQIGHHVFLENLLR